MRGNSISQGLPAIFFTIQTPQIKVNIKSLNLFGNLLLHFTTEIQFNFTQNYDTTY